MSEPVPLLAIYRIVDEAGAVVRELVVRGDVAAILAATEPRLKETTFADLNGKRPAGARPVGPEDVEDSPRRKTRSLRAAKPEGGFAWEGPRYRITWFLGESRTWQGPDQEDFCGGRELPPGAYCLHCDRSGRDRDLPPVTEEDLRKRDERRAYRPDPHLKGGQR